VTDREAARMTTQWKAAGIVGAVLALALIAFFLLGNKTEDLPGIGAVLDPKTCPLTGEEPAHVAALDRPAVAVKVENASIAYPLSGLEDADVVFEEAVEGGITRFMAVYHCTDTDRAGPVRSARLIDPAIMTPITRILAFSGANKPVLQALDKAGVVTIQESAAGSAMQRVARPGISSEHTLYADSAKIRKIGAKKFDEAPGDPFAFGDLPDGGRKASKITITFSGATTVGYDWKGGRWRRAQAGAPFVAEGGGQVAVDNVLIEEHEVNFSPTIVDVAGNPSVEIADVTGSGRAMLFRDGRAIAGRWTRESVDEPVVFETRTGEEMVLHPGSTWVELVPSATGDVKGSFSFEK
jgi:hypothetical protein